jgi:hypothetical protein
MDKRLKTVTKLAFDLRQLSSEYNCAVLTINQFTRKIRITGNSNEAENRNQFTTSLGITWRSHIDTCIYLNGNDISGR